MKASLASLAEFKIGRDRPVPVYLPESQSVNRVQELVPIRLGRMVSSAFASYRGAALVMASDLAPAPSPGLNTQI